MSQDHLMHADLGRLETELASSLAGLDAVQTQATPPGGPDKWSIQQIVEHLLKTYRASVGAIEVRVAKRTPTRAKPSLAQRLGQFTLITLGRFPGGREAPAAVMPTLPTSASTGAELAGRAHAELLQLDAATGAGEKIFGGQRAASHLVLGPLSMRQWRRFHLVHGRHHIRQILAIRKGHGF